MPNLCLRSSSRLPTGGGQPPRRHRNGRSEGPWETEPPNWVPTTAERATTRPRRRPNRRPRSLPAHPNAGEEGREVDRTASRSPPRKGDWVEPSDGQRSALASTASARWLGSPRHCVAHQRGAPVLLGSAMEPNNRPLAVYLRVLELRGLRNASIRALRSSVAKARLTRLI
jgi:hypothetical protein